MLQRQSADTNSKIASVSSDGIVEGKSEGKAIIKVRTKDGGYTAKCSVTVKSPVTITLPSIPLEISEYSYRGVLEKNVRLLILDIRLKKFLKNMFIIYSTLPPITLA